MNQVVLTGVNATNPLGFMAALGLFRLADRQGYAARLGFLTDGSFCPFVAGVETPLETLVADDATRGGDEQAWRLRYTKQEKRGTKEVADLKAPPPVFMRFLEAAIDHWHQGEAESAAYGAAFGTSVAVDGKGNTKPTAFHFTAANQQFLGTVEEIRAAITLHWARESLFDGHASRPGSNLRWDPSADRNWALMASDPNDDGTSVDAPLEWLAFRSLPLFPSFPRSARRIVTTAVSGRRQHEMRMTWPLWSVPMSLAGVRSALVLDWTGRSTERRGRGVFAVCTSEIRRTSQGFGNFSPAEVSS